VRKQTRRRAGAVIGLVLAAVSLLVGAVESPTVIDLVDMAQSSRSAFLSAIWALESVLATDIPLTAQQMSRLVWSDRDVAQFVAGVLASSGYEVLLAEGTGPTGTAISWILVGIPLAEGTGWVPVSAALTGASRVASVAWADGSEDVRFDTVYKAFDLVSELPANVAPSAAFANTYVRGTVVDELTPFLALGQDVDGRVVAYRWTVDEEEPVLTEVASYRYTFTTLGKHAVQLTVYDNRGASTTVRITFDVLEERAQCIRC